jgi:hypothetical protein
MENEGRRAMSYTQKIQGYIEITRQQIICQLREEISHMQGELGGLPSDSRDILGNWKCHKGIAHKRQLISRLS